MKFSVRHTYRKIVVFNRKTKLRQFLARKNYTNFRPEENILITGSPRSGTTWLGELMEEYTDSMMLFEPLALNTCPKFNELGFSWRQHIPEDASWKEAKDVFNQVFECKYVNMWMMSHTKLDRIKTTNSFIVKFVRANLLLPWLIKNFELRYKPIYLVRHPFSVISSQINLDWSKGKSVEIQENAFNTTYNKQYEKVISEANSPLQKALLRWCLDNVYLLHHPDRDHKWVTVYYEDLFINPDKEFKRIIQEMNLPFDQHKYDGIDFQKISSTAFKEAPDISEKINQLSKWKNKFTSEDIQQGIEMLNSFGITDYNEEVMPLKSRYQIPI